MYSNEDIVKAVERGDLVIDPYFRESVKAAGLTLHLGAQLLKPLPGKIVDVKTGEIPDFEEISISSEQPYSLKPSEFLLGHTLEKVTVGSTLGFFIEGRSTLARIGLTIVQTAMLVYPGHRDRSVTLELANHGPNTINLYAGMKIARAAIFELTTPSSIDYDRAGKYREQVSVGKPIFKNEIREFKRCK